MVITNITGDLICIQTQLPLLNQQHHFECQILTFWFGDRMIWKVVN